MSAAKLRSFPASERSGGASGKIAAMVTFDPSQALTTLESAVRQVMRSAYASEYGPGWFERVTSPDQREKWKTRRKDEAPKRRGVVQSPTLELDFSELWELIAIAGKHWPPLASALGKQKSTMPLLETFERLRNAVSHSRTLQPFEQELLSGIAGSIRNQVTISLSATDPSGEYYPRIESITDSYGNRIDPGRSQGLFKVSVKACLRPLVGALVYTRFRPCVRAQGVCVGTSP